MELVEPAEPDEEPEELAEPEEPSEREEPEEPEEPADLFDLGLDDEIQEEEPDLAASAAVEDPRPLAAIEHDIEEEDRDDAFDRVEVDEPVVAAEPSFYRGELHRERPRPAMLPMAMMLVLGLLLGFFAGYFVGGREQTPQTENPAAAAQPNPVPPTTQTPTQSGRAFSEQVVTPPPPPTQPTPAPPAPLPVPETPAGARGAGREARTAAATRGRLVVQSTPPGASVTINGKWSGRTPLTLTDLAFGPYTVRVVQSGFAVAREEFSLSAAAPAKTMNVRLTASGAKPAPAPAASAQKPTGQNPTGTGSIYVDSRPRGARVVIDGRPAGVTPLQVDDVKVGSHSVRLELAEHRTWVTTAVVERGKRTNVAGSLDRIQ